MQSIDKDEEKPFVWVKAREKRTERGEEAGNQTCSESPQDLLQELEQAKRRRIEREMERVQQREARQSLPKRDESDSFQAVEDSFQFGLIAKRIGLRIAQNRPTMLDLIFHTLLPRHFPDVPSYSSSLSST